MAVFFGSGDSGKLGLKSQSVEVVAVLSRTQGVQSVGRGKGRGKHNREEVHGIPDPKWFMIGRSERGLANGVFVGIRAPMFFSKIQGSPPQR